MTELRFHLRLAARVGTAGLLGAIVGIGGSYLVRSQFAVRATFVAETREPSQNLSALAGLAAQFGVGMGGGSAYPPQFFAEVLKSREVLLPVLEQPWQALGGGSGDVRRVMDYFARPRGDSLRQISAALDAVRGRLMTTVGGRTAIVEVELEVPDPEAGVVVLRSLLESLDRFNRFTKRSQAKERRAFAEARLLEATDSLLASEDALRVFLERNRSYRESPGLMMVFETRQRRIAASQELVTLVRREYETARLVEVNDTPVLTVLDRPSLPARRSSPVRILWALAGMGIALLVVAGVGVRERGMLGRK